MIRPIVRPLLLLGTLAASAAVLAQTDPAIQRIRASTGVSENRAAERMVQEDAAADAAVERGELPPEETPRPAEPVPRGEIDVGTATPLDEGEEPDPAADREDDAEE